MPGRTPLPAINSESDLHLIDFGGHPFTAELAGALHSSGVGVAYSYCSSNDSAPHADMDALSALGLPIRAIDIGRSFEKHRPLVRLLHEIQFGFRAAHASTGDTVVACQLPVVSAWILLVICTFRRQSFVLWLQDFQADLAGLTGRRGVVRVLKSLEAGLIRRSPQVVAISDGFAERCRALGRAKPVIVLPNWAPLERLPLVERENAWSESLGLEPGRFRVVYSGTMGTKHRAEELLRMAEQLAEAGGFDVVVVSAGAGIDSIRSRLQALDHTHVLPLQPHEYLSSVMGSADALVVTLDPSATEACVPSKVLSYLCAGRPIVGLIDPDNPSAKLVTSASAGQVVTDVGQLLEVLERLRHDSVEHQTMGRGARSYAEEHFAQSRIVDDFLGAVSMADLAGSEI